MKRARWLVLIVLALLPGMAHAQGITDTDAVANGVTANGVVIENVHYFVVPMDDRLRIAEYYLVGNTGASVYEGRENVDGTRVTLTFTLPEGANNLIFDGPGLGERYVGDSMRFADTTPIPPGAAVVEIGFSYELPFAEGMRIERAVDAPVTLAALIISSESIGLAGPGLIPQGLMNTQMGPAASYSAGPLAAGEPLVFTFVPQTMTTAPAAASPGSAAAPAPRAANPLRDIGLGVIALALAGLGVYWLWRPPSTHVPAPPEAARPVLAALAALDARFAAGELPEEAYRQERDALKQQLLAQLQQP